MGFTNETHNLMLLKQLNGNMDAVAEILLTEASENNNGNNSNNTGTASSSNDPLKKKPSNINTQTISIPKRTASMSGRNVTPSPRSSSLNHSYSSPSYEYSNGLNQLKAMGFTDINQMKSALQKV